MEKQKQSQLIKAQKQNFSFRELRTFLLERKRSSRREGRFGGKVCKLQTLKQIRAAPHVDMLAMNGTLIAW